MDAPKSSSKASKPKDSSLATPSHPSSPSAAPGPGPTRRPAALGFDRQFSPQHLHPDSPIAPLDWPPDEHEDAAADRPLGAPLTLDPFADALDQDRPEGSVRSRAAQAWQYIRDRLTAENIYALQAMIQNPELALSIGQQELINRIGRYATVGDKSGVRRSMLDLVEKLDVKSPIDGAVLVVRPDPGAPMSNNLLQQLAGLEAGKQSLQTTQGGKVLNALAPILAENGTFTGKDGMDRAWGRLTQRFTQQAQGQMDIIVALKNDPLSLLTGAQPGQAPMAQTSPIVPGRPPMTQTPPFVPGQPPMAQTPPFVPGKAPGPPGVGQWSIPGQQPPPAVGQWQVPGAPTDPSSAPVGQWIPPGQAGNAQLAGGGDQAIGQWQVPGTPSDPGNPPVGQWVPPGQAGNAQLASGGDQGIGQWQVPGTPSDPSRPPVGQWVPPEQAGNAQLSSGGDRGIGQWQVPGTPSDPSRPPVGQWVPPEQAGNAQLSSGGDRGIGQWQVPGTPTDPARPPVGEWVPPNAQGGAELTGGGDAGIGQWAIAGRPQAGGAQPITSQIGQWIQAKDVPLGDGVNLSDVIRQNPNISGVRLVELIPGQGGQQSRLGTLANAARSILAQRFGL